MARFKKIAGDCLGKGFSDVHPSGFLSKFYDWINNSGDAHWPGWYILDDHSHDSYPYIVITDTLSGTANDFDTAPNGGAPKYLKIGYYSGDSSKISIQNFCWWVSGVGGYGLWSGAKLDNIADAGPFAYDFRGGDECMMILARNGTTYRQYIVDDFVGITSELEDETHVAYLPSGVSTLGSSGVAYLTDGDASKFTVGRHYYLYDFNSYSHVDFVMVLDRDTTPGSNSITISLTGVFPSGSVIGSYPHRHYSFHADHSWTYDMYSFFESNIPYYSYNPSVYYRSDWPIHGGIELGFDLGDDWYSPITAALQRSWPNDYGYYAVARPLLLEYRNNTSPDSSSGMHFMYGYGKNTVIGGTGSFTRGISTKIVGGKTYLFFMVTNEVIRGASSSYPLYVLDTESES